MNELINEPYAGLDVSLQSVLICVSDAAGKILWRGEFANDPSDVVQTLKVPGTQYITIDVCPLSTRRSPYHRASRRKPLYSGLAAPLMRSSVSNTNAL